MQLKLKYNKKKQKIIPLNIAINTDEIAKQREIVSSQIPINIWN